MSNHQKRMEEVIGRIEARRDSYGSVLVKSAVVKTGNVWESIVVNIVPLHKSESYNPKKKFDYGDFILFEELLALDRFVEIIKKLPENGSVSVNLGNYDIKINGQYLQNGYKYDSGEEHFNTLSLSSVEAKKPHC